MKRSCLSILLLVLVNATCFSQWKGINPLPFPYALIDVCFPTQTTGYIVGERGTVYKTTDQGLNWAMLQIDTYTFFRQAEFPDENTGYLRGDDNFIYKTIDGGVDWVKITLPAGAEATAMCFVNADTGFIAGKDGMLLRTDNGGNSWDELASGIQWDLNCLFFLNDTLGFAGSRLGTILKTTDGGNSWDSYQEPSMLDIDYIFFENENVGYATGGFGYFIKTTNGGNSWGQISQQYTLTEIYFTGEGTGYAIPDEFMQTSGPLLKTTNGGSEWRPVGMQSCNNFAFADGNTLIGINHDGEIFRSEDTGATFTNYQSTITEQSLIDIHFPDHDNGYILGAFQDTTTLLKTTDGGENWEVVFEGHEWMESIFFTSASTGFMAGKSSTVYKTTDGGFTWNPSLEMRNFAFNHVFFVNELTGFVTNSEYGTIYKTTDAGNSWSIIYSSLVKPAQSVFFLNENIGYAVSPYFIHKTIDGGATWTEKYIETGNGHFLELFFANENTGYAGGFGETLFKTTDGGATWFDIWDHSHYNSIHDMYFTDENTGYICADGCTVLQTHDGGTTYTRLDYLPCDWYDAVWFTDDQTGFIVGGHGKILKTNNKGAVPAISLEKPVPFCTMFPNPASSLVTIKSNSPDDHSATTVTIYSSNGAEILTSKFSQSEIALDISTLQPGVYFLRIKTSKAMETQKLIVY